MSSLLLCRLCSFNFLDRISCINPCTDSTTVTIYICVSLFYKVSSSNVRTSTSDMTTVYYDLVAFIFDSSFLCRFLYNFFVIICNCLFAFFYFFCFSVSFFQFAVTLDHVVFEVVFETVLFGRSFSTWLVRSAFCSGVYSASFIGATELIAPGTCCLS